MLFPKICESLGPLAAAFFLEFAEADHNKVNQPADAKKTTADQPKNTGTNFARHKTMNTQATQEEGNEDSSDFVYKNTLLFCLLQSNALMKKYTREGEECQKKRIAPNLFGG